MSGQQLIGMEACNLSAHVMFADHSNPVVCTITDISSSGCFLVTDANILVPDVFDLYIGLSSLPRACRITHREAYGIIVDFLDPVRHQVEEILGEYAFKEALLFEALSPSLKSDDTALKGCIRNTVEALMGLIERRNAMSWQIADYRSDRFVPTSRTLHVAGKVLNQVPPQRLSSAR